MARTKEYKIKISEEGAKQVQKEVSSIDKAFVGLKKAAVAFVAAIGVREIASFALESSKLVGTMTGLRKALEGMAHREGLLAFELMQDLREATAGTVTEMQLMQAATQAKFLGIDLKNLPTLFEFASKRAKDTGQDIDYLVDSIVTGIGRKSALILDNLGIQMKDLNDEVAKIAKETGTWTGRVDDNLRSLHLQQAAVNIANKALAESEATFDDTASEAERLNVAWESFTIAVGAILSGPVAEALEFINSAFKTLGINIDYIISTGLERKLLDINEEIKTQTNRFDEAFNRITNYSEATERLTSAWTYGQTVGKNQLQLEDDLLMAYYEGTAAEQKRIKIIEELAKQEKEENKETEKFIGYQGEILTITPELNNMIGQSVQLYDNLKVKTKDLTDEIEEMNPAILNMANTFSSVLQSAIIEQVDEGGDAIKRLGTAFIGTIEAMAAAVMARAAIFGALSFLGAPMGAGGLVGRVFGGFFQQGGPMMPGHYYSINERREETFVPSMPGRVEPGREVTINIQASDPISFEQWLRENDGGKKLMKLLAEA